MSRRRSPVRSGLLTVTAMFSVGAAGCGSPASTTSDRPKPTVSAAVNPSASATESSPAAASIGTPSHRGGRYVFPVLGNVSYARTHHDYPATDIMAPCGATVVSPVDGAVLEVTRVDTYDPKVNAGATRGGLSVSILGGDGARYYASHFSLINDGIAPGVAVQAGKQLGKVGKSGDASACHVHFGLSPVCARTGDWWTRRGVIWPWSYLDAWRGGVAKSPINELVAWKADHGCPAKPLVNP